MSDPFQELYATEKNLRMRQKVEAAHQMRKWQIATAALTVGLLLTGSAVVIQRRPRQPALGGDVGR